MEKHKKEGGAEHSGPSLGVILEKNYSDMSFKKLQKNKGTVKGKGANKSGATSEDGEVSQDSSEREGDLVTALSLYFLRVELRSREGKEDGAMAAKADFSNPRFFLSFFMSSVFL